MVEGNGALSLLCWPFDVLGKAIILLLLMLQSYFGTERYIVFDSGFCVLEAIIEFKRNGLFGCTLIKKRCYWPAHVPGDAMNDFCNKEGVQLGDCHTISGTFDTIPYNLWGMKEPDYVMKMMACGDTSKHLTRTVRRLSIARQRMASNVFDDSATLVHSTGTSPTSMLSTTTTIFITCCL